MTKEKKGFLESALRVQYLYCSYGFIGHFKHVDICHMPKFIKFHFQYVQFTACQLYLNKAVRKQTEYSSMHRRYHLRVLRMQIFYYFLLFTAHLKH